MVFNILPFNIKEILVFAVGPEGGVMEIPPSLGLCLGLCSAAGPFRLLADVSLQVAALLDGLFRPWFPSWLPVLLLLPL
jgi:hypothetical protein